MFTGLIQEIGIIKEIQVIENALYFTVSCSKILEQIRIGDSVAINGACQTVVEFSSDSFKVFASSETLQVTAFKDYKVGEKVNLERTMRLTDRLDGHMVSGHVDCVASVKNIVVNGCNTTMTIEFPLRISNQLVNKGSVAIDGISLTIVNVTASTFDIVLIPLTLKSTNLQYKKIGDTVNLETDIIAKYVEKYLSSKNNSSNITMDLLERNGFL